MARTKQVHPTVQAVFDEHIALPGCPQIIVTRGWAYSWLRDSLGYDPRARGFASLDYMVFGKRETREPLTDVNDPTIQRTLRFIEQTENGTK